MAGARKSVGEQTPPEAAPESGAQTPPVTPESGTPVAPEVPPAPDATPPGVAPGDVAPTAPAQPERDTSDVPYEGHVEVVMLVGITGTRNGEKWPAVGGTVALPADEAAQYIANGYARLPE